MGLVLFLSLPSCKAGPARVGTASIDTLLDVALACGALSKWLLSQERG